MEFEAVKEAPYDQPVPTKDGTTGHGFRAGTFVFVAFSAISLLVSVVKGIVPIFLIEAALWAAAAWYWQAKKTHSEVTKGVVTILAILIAIGEVVHIAIQANSASQSKPPVAVVDSTGSLQDKPQPAPLSPCPSGIRAGAKITEIEPDQVEGSSGVLWYEAPDKDLGEIGGWYFHFTVVNHAKDFCLTAIEYEVNLELDDGTILKGQGKKHIDTLSPEWKYTPDMRVPDDKVTFAVKSKNGALSSWQITKAYGFSQETALSQ